MERMWCYTIGGKDQRGPISESELRAALEAGVISRAELVWTEGMAGWEPVSDRPEFAQAPNPAPSSDDVLLAAPPFPVAPESQPARVAQKPTAPFGGWLTFVGIMNILGGSLLSFTCVGIPMGILMIIAGAAAMGARTAMEQAATPPRDYAPVIAKVRTYFVLTGVILLLNLLGFLLVFVNMSGMALMFSRMAEQFK